MMPPRSIVSALAECMATQDGVLHQWLRERRLANISAGRGAAAHFSGRDSRGVDAPHNSDLPDYLSQAEELARALQARGFAIVERE